MRIMPTTSYRVQTTHRNNIPLDGKTKYSDVLYSAVSSTYAL